MGGRCCWLIFLLVISLSVPLMILLVPAAVWMILRARGTAKIPALALLAGVAVQLYIYANAGMDRGQSALFNFREVIPSTGAYLVFRAVLSSLMGRTPAAVLYARGAFVPSLLIGISGPPLAGMVVEKSRPANALEYPGLPVFCHRFRSAGRGRPESPTVI